MPKSLFISLPVADVPRSITFYEALGFTRKPQMSDDSGACMVWSEAISVMLVSHAKWRTFTQRPFPAPGTIVRQAALARQALTAARPRRC